MKKSAKVTSLILIVSFVFIIFAVSGLAAETDRLPETYYASDGLYYPDKYLDDFDYYGFRGRLLLPDAGVDVALYNDMSQYVCDRQDSASFFSLDGYYGEIIADHNNQEFATLVDVYPGEIGEISLADGTLLLIRCVSAFEGHNTGYVITDGNWNSVFGRTDITMYTCLDNWQNVFVCQWEYIPYDAEIVEELQYAVDLLQGR